MMFNLWTNLFKNCVSFGSGVDLMSLLQGGVFLRGFLEIGVLLPGCSRLTVELNASGGSVNTS